jgi:hypothetical protein
MPWTFNPFSGTFDQKGSGGGASYIDGEVAVYADLPLDGTAPLNSAWLVRGNSGVWPFNKPAGIYYRSATGGTSRDADYTFGGTLGDVFADNVFLLYDNSDSTRNLQFDLGSITTGTTRTLTAPNASGRIQVEGQPIGNTTPAAGTFTTLTANNGTLTASAPVLDLAQTWNASGTAFTALTLALTNTASASASSYFNINLDGVEAFSIRRGESNVSATLIRCGGSGLRWTARTRTGGGVGLNFEHTLGIGSSLEFLATASGTTGGDVVLLRDGASDTLAQRRSTNAQTFNIYNTFTSATNHERGFLKWSSNVFQIGTEKGSGGGSARALEFQTDGVTRMTIATGGDVTAGGFVIGASSIAPTSGTRSYLVASGAGLVQVTDGAALGVGSSAPRFAAFSNNRCGMRVEGEFGWASSGSPTNANFDLILRRDAAGVLAQYNGSNAQAYRLYNTSSSGNANFERLNIRWASNECIIDAEAGGTGTSLRGIKLGSATSSLLGFYGATPVDRPATVADPAGGGTIDAEARTAINAIIDRLQELGLIA